jgi:hypothetical protein
MNEHLEALQQKWLAEMAGWEHAAEMSRSDEGVSMRCTVRAQTIKSCLDDLKLAIKP